MNANASTDSAQTYSLFRSRMPTKKTKANKLAKKAVSGVPMIPTAGHLLIEPIEAEKKTASGIYLPATAEKKTQTGKVLAVGPDEVTESGLEKTSPVEVDDVVVYKQWGGSEVRINDKDYLFAKFEDILAVLS